MPSGAALILWRYVKMIELQYESKYDGFLVDAVVVE